MMGRGVVYSLVLHLGVVALSYYGLPALRRPPPLADVPIIVEVVVEAETTTAPAPEPEPPKAEEPPPPLPPEPPKVEEVPPPLPEPEPEPEVAAVPPPPEPKPKPKPKPEPEAKPKPKPPSKLAMIKPPRKPKPPDAFSSVLKTVEDLKKQKPAPKPKPEPEEKKKEEKTFDAAEIAKVLSSTAPRTDTARRLTMSEIDMMRRLVRRQIARCWSIPAGAKDAKDLVIEIRVDMNPDGTPRQARIEDQGRLTIDPFFRASAESALRAVLNHRCHPFKLPPDRYDHWKTMTLVFNPREMF